MKTLFVHGVGFHETTDALAAWPADWKRAIEESSQAAGAPLAIDDPLGADGRPGGGDDLGILYYEDVIRSHPAPSGGDYLAAVGSLLRSYLETTVGGWFRRERGFAFDDDLLWKARQIAAWVVDDDLRRALRDRLVEKIRTEDPALVVAHSFGGLIAYDACLFGDAGLMENRFFVTLGTQIGNPLLRREFGGRQIPVRARHWFNLHNPKDPVFVAPLDHIRSDDFTHVEVRHAGGHDPAGYLGHATTAANVWKPIHLGKTWTKAMRGIRPLRHRPKTGGNRRALLIGIDDYAHPAIQPLGGCVNDTYLLSAVLQEAGVEPGEIHMLHNGRATREAILSEFEWLLADVEPGDHRFFSFSGHGHQLPSVNAAGEADELDEILTTHDYEFDAGGGLRDKDLQRLYADLPVDSHFIMFLDCCHSGGMSRNGGPLVRAVTGPPDLEHRCIRWNARAQMWEQYGLRGSKGINPEFLKPPRTKSGRTDADEERALYYGQFGDVRRIGRATQLRDLPYQRYDSVRERIAKLNPGHAQASLGPYLPMIFMACREDERACEYVHGSVSYGAFTYAMVQALRDALPGKPPRPPTYGSLVKAAKKKLELLGYSQQPSLLAHAAQKRTRAPVGGK